MTDKQLTHEEHMKFLVSYSKEKGIAFNKFLNVYNSINYGLYYNMSNPPSGKVMFNSDLEKDCFESTKAFFNGSN
jgi:hypothetical protein